MEAMAAISAQTGPSERRRARRERATLSPLRGEAHHLTPFHFTPFHFTPVQRRPGPAAAEQVAEAADGDREAAAAGGGVEQPRRREALGDVGGPDGVSAAATSSSPSPTARRVAGHRAGALAQRGLELVGRPVAVALEQQRGGAGGDGGGLRGAAAALAVVADAARRGLVDERAGDAVGDDRGAGGEHVGVARRRRRGSTSRRRRRRPGCRCPACPRRRRRARTGRRPGSSRPVAGVAVVAARGDDRDAGVPRALDRDGERLALVAVRRCRRRPRA